MAKRASDYHYSFILSHPGLHNDKEKSFYSEFWVLCQAQTLVSRFYFRYTIAIL